LDESWILVLYVFRFRYARQPVGVESLVYADMTMDERWILVLYVFRFRHASEPVGVESLVYADMTMDERWILVLYVFRFRHASELPSFCRPACPEILPLIFFFL
jgi:hypothetical protein